MARGGRHGAKVAPSPNVQALRQIEERTCPLCIEPLDATEQLFFPCACGYQLCLFCYDRIKTECGNLCPGCRTEYSSEKELQKKPDARQQKGSHSGPGSTEQSPQKHSPNAHRLASPAGKALHASPGNRSRAAPAQAIPIPLPPPPPPPPPAARHTQQWPQQGSQSEAAESLHASSGSSAPSPSAQAARKGHPGTATVAVPVRRRNQAVQQKQDAQPATVPLHASQPEAHSSGSSRPELGAGSSSQEGSRVAMQNGVHPPPPRWPNASAADVNRVSAAAAAVCESWRLQKKRQGPAAPDHEGFALAESMRQAVRAGRMSTKEAAACLLAFLQQHEVEQEMLRAACSSSLGEHTQQAGQPSQPLPSYQAQPAASIWGAEAAGAMSTCQPLWAQPGSAVQGWLPWAAASPIPGAAQEH